nr:MAG: replication associated protein [Cressdnaviricota sp.]
MDIEQLKAEDEHFSSLDVKDKYRSAKYFFTWNNPPITGDAFLEALVGLQIIRSRFQLEEGESGTPHFQGGVVFTKTIRRSQLTKQFKGIHLEKLHQDVMTYGIKEEGRLAGPWSYGDFSFAEIRKPTTGLEGHELYPWQQDIIDLCKTVPTDKRTVNWYFSRDGAKGKTSVQKYLIDNFNALIVSGTSAKDAICQIADRVCPEKGEPKPLDIVMINITKEEAGREDYSILEAIKDGLMVNSKYRSRQVRFADVHLLVFSNGEPCRANMSADRWANVVEIE